MRIELKIPEVGESIREVQIGEWLKAEGDTVKKDDPVAIIDSEKTTFDLPATHSGKLTKILHKTGETVDVDTVVAHLETDGDTGQPVTPTAPAKANQESKTTDAPKPEENQSAITPEREKKQVTQTEPKSPPIESGPKSAPAGSAPQTAPAAANPEKPSEKKPESPAQDEAAASDSGEEVVPMSMLRRTVARRLVEAKQAMAMLTTFGEVDMSTVQALRKGQQEAFEKRYQVRLGLMSFFVKAAVDALKQFPQLNAEVRGNDIVYRNYFNIGVAIATERGLVVPVLRCAEHLSFSEIEKAIDDFVRRANGGQLKPDELEHGTFTITNGGSFGSLLSTPIINPPQSGILGLHKIEDRPVAFQGQVVIRPMMYIALTYDHRIVDGREAVLFLQRIKEAIENPARMLIEI